MVGFWLNKPDCSKTCIRIAWPDQTACEHRLDTFAQNQRGCRIVGVPKKDRALAHRTPRPSRLIGSMRLSPSLQVDLSRLHGDDLAVSVGHLGNQARVRSRTWITLIARGPAKRTCPRRAEASVFDQKPLGRRPGDRPRYRHLVADPQYRLVALGG